MPETQGKPLELCVVGCGGIAQAYLQALQRTPTLKLIAAVDTDAARADAAAAPHGARTARDVHTLLQEGMAFDAALVLTPPNTHEALATALLAAGAHVLCEKPLTVSTQAAQRMLQAAKAHRRLLMMGSKFRYTPDMAKAKALLDQGILGEVTLFENVFCARVDMQKRWNSVRSIAGGGVLLDNGCHSVDIARYLLGPIARVQALFGKPVQKLEVEDTVRLMFEAQSGAMGAIDLSWSLHKEVPSYVRLYGSKGTMEIGWKTSRYKLQGEGDWTAFGQGYDKVGAFQAQLENFAGAIRGTEEPVITETDAIASVQVIEEAYRSAHEQKWHELV
ncbi:MAG: Gfo/Idh/MocA family protein [Planctomycetota bacterium]